MERRDGNNLGIDQFMPSVEEKTTIAEAATEVVEKLPENKQKELENSFKHGEMMVMHAGMRFTNMLTRRMPPGMR